MTGKSIGDYAVHQPLGEGPFGDCHLAEHKPTGRMAVLKKVRAELVAAPRIGERLRAQAISPPVLEHEGILSLRSIHLEGEDVWIIRDYSPGAALDQNIAKAHKAGAAAAARQFCGLLEAFAYAHRRGFHHLDLRMSNIRVESGRFVAADFAISRLFGVSGLTREMLGAVEFRPPEQALGDELDARSDVYSLGKILLMLGAAKESTLPDWLLPIVAKATEADPQSRYRSAAEFHQALLAVIPESKAAVEAPLIALQAARPQIAEPAMEPPPPPASRRGFGIPMAAGIALAVGSASMLWNFHRTSETAAASGDSAAVAVVAGNTAGNVAAKGAEKQTKIQAAPKTAAIPTTQPAPAVAVPPAVLAAQTTPPVAPATKKEFVWNRPAATQEAGTPALPAAQLDVAPRGTVAPPPVTGVETRVAPPPEPVAETKPVVQPEPAQRVSGKLVGARLLRGGSPTYPPFAKQLKVSGTVRLEIRIGADGKVAGVRTIAGHPVLASAAAEASRRWIYAPATLDGTPIVSTTQVDISFTSK